MQWDARWQDGVNLLAGIWLMLSHMLGVTSVSFGAGWTAYVAGALITVMAGGALVDDSRAYQAVNLIAGVALLVAPYVLGVTEFHAATLNFLVVGFVVAATAISVNFSRGPLPTPQ